MNFTLCETVVYYTVIFAILTLKYSNITFSVLMGVASY